jgi:ATP-dependent RNA helicase DeaD
MSEIDGPGEEPSHDPAPPIVSPAPAPAATADVAPPEPPLPASFPELGLSGALLDAVTALGWRVPTPVQARTFRPMSEGRDVLVQSHTGSGKTGAFCLPWLGTRFQPGPAAETGVQLLVLLPTRELAKQVCGELEKLALASPVEVLPVYGGTAIVPQLDALKRGVHAVVGTPGRILDHIRRRSLRLSQVRTVVLDECDEMLSMGFLEDIRAILEVCPRERQTCLFSATVPGDIARIAKRHMIDPVRVELSGDQVAAAEIRHAYYQVASSIKTRDLMDVLMVEDPVRAIVFCNTREEVKLVASVLQREGLAAEMLSSDLTQAQRERVMEAMRDHRLRFLVATDVAARGIDISEVSHVINYSFPEAPDVYVHRTGRTGRAGRLGQAISLIGSHEIGNFYLLKKLHPSITFEERALPPADELAAQRLEVKLDAISQQFPQLVSPDWALLARSLMKDPRGERVIAFLLSEAMRRAPARPPVEEEDRGEDAAAPFAPDRDRDRDRPHRDRDDRRRRRRDDRGRDRHPRRRDRDERDVAAPPAENAAAAPEPAVPDAATPLGAEAGHTPAADPSAERAEGGGRKRRRRRRRRRGGEAPAEASATTPDTAIEDPSGGHDEDQGPAGENGEGGPEGASADVEGEGDGSRRRRRRRRRRRGGAAPAPEAAPPPVAASQDTIIIDIDEAELDVVRTEFGEIDELGDLTLKGRRRAVIEELAEEVVLEDMSGRDAELRAAEDEDAEGEAEDEQEPEAQATAAPGEPAPATPAGVAPEAAPLPVAEPAAEESPDEPGAADQAGPAQRKRRRRRRRKKAPLPAPELTAPPHKDFWEVWAAKFTWRDFERPDDSAAPIEEPPPPPREDRGPVDDGVDEGELVLVQLDIGRAHGLKSADVRRLLDARGLRGRSVKDLTVRDQDTRFRMPAAHFEEARTRLNAEPLDGRSLVLDRAEAGADAAMALPARRPAEHGESPSEPAADATAETPDGPSTP